MGQLVVCNNKLNADVLLAARLRRFCSAHAFSERGICEQCRSQYITFTFHNKRQHVKKNKSCTLYTVMKINRIHGVFLPSTLRSTFWAPLSCQFVF